MHPESYGAVGQWMDTKEKANMWLITQRSKVQILPPQPIKSITYLLHFKNLPKMLTIGRV